MTELNTQEVVTLRRYVWGCRVCGRAVAFIVEGDGNTTASEWAAKGVSLLESIGWADIEIRDYKGWRFRWPPRWPLYGPRQAVSGRCECCSNNYAKLRWPEAWN